MTNSMYEQLIISAQKNYDYYNTKILNVEIEGKKYDVEFHHVGHNSSHSFDIGLLPDGRMVLRSSGEGCEWDHELDCPVLEARVRVWTHNNAPYVGHW